MRRVLAAALLAGAMVAPLVRAQSAQTAKTSGNKLEFDVASVKPNKSDEKASSNFPLGPGDVYVPNGGRFSATNLPAHYIHFVRL